MFAPRSLLVTGGAGFIGVNVVRFLLEHDPAVRIVNLDLLTYAGNLESLTDVFERHGPKGDGRHFFIRADVRDFDALRTVLAGEARETAHADGASTEATPLAPNSPYSASKAASDLLVRSYVETFDFPAIITRCSNNYGPYQFPEKLIPLMITRALADQPLPVYGDGKNVRDWLYVEDHARALYSVLTRGRVGEVY